MWNFHIVWSLSLWWSIQVGNGSQVHTCDHEIMIGTLWIQYPAYKSAWETRNELSIINIATLIIFTSKITIRLHGCFINTPVGLKAGQAGRLTAVSSTSVWSLRPPLDVISLTRWVWLKALPQHATRDNQDQCRPLVQVQYLDLWSWIETRWTSSVYCPSGL